MTEKERYATIGTWVAVFRKEGVEVSYQTIARRLKAANAVGQDARDSIGRVIRAGFYAESEVRRLVDDLFAVLFRADENGYFEHDGETYGTIRTLAKLINISAATINRRVLEHSLASVKGRNRTGEIFDFYSLSEVRLFCSDLLQEYLQVGENGLLEKDGEIYGTIPALARLLNISTSSMRSRIQKDGLKPLQVKDSKDHLRSTYSLSEFRKICFDLLNPLDSDYFENPDNVRHDLSEFGSQLEEGQTTLDLSTHNIVSLNVTCQNGRFMKGGTYLRNAAIALGFAAKDEEAGSKLAQTLKHLLKVGGFEILDKDYFGNPGNIRFDLAVFASKLEEGRDIFDLSAGSMAPLIVTCHNGQIIKGDRYLRHAAIALGLAHDYEETSTIRVQTFKFLIKAAGFEVLDADYFRDPNHLRGDFMALAAQLGEDRSPLDLNAKNILALSIVCGNGQPMLGETYLHTAAKALGMAKDVKEASGKKAEVLKYLLGLADLRPFDRSYFQNPDNVRADLSAFASRLGADNIPSRLNTGNIRPLAITCSNGQLMRGYTYLNHASKALGLARNKAEAKSKWTETLRLLKETAGFLIKPND